MMTGIRSAVDPGFIGNVAVLKNRKAVSRVSLLDY